jgi:hypothetical protein
MLPFKLVALLFLVVNGVQAEKPHGFVTAEESFASKEGCNNYLASERGAEFKKALENLVETQKGALAIGVQCIKAPKTEDNSI